VNDYAEVLSEAAEAQITDKLKALKAENGTEITVLTIATRNTYGLHSSLEGFARDIFNDWGVGDANKNNGVLLLVAVEDRQARIELGSGYGSAMNETAAEILDKDILPEFAGRNFETGILQGTDAMIARFGKGEPGTSGGWFTEDKLVPIGIFAMFAALLGFKFRSNRRARRCPNCGSYLMPVAFLNSNDDHHGGGGSFGGGSSSGGGASGNW